MRIFKLLLSPRGDKTKPLKAVFSMLLVAVALIVFVYASLIRVDVKLDFRFLTALRFRLWDGFAMTVALSVCSMAASLVIGVLSAAGRNSPLLPVRYLCGAYVSFIRGTPLIMQIYLFFYIIGTAWGGSNRFVTGVIIMSVFEGAYISEIIRGSLLSMDASQLEAAKAVGFTKWQTYKHVILPQLTARTLPALTGQFASIIKDSSLLSVIAVTELTQTIREITAINFAFFECYFFLGLLYLCLTLPVSYISKTLERRFSYEH